ncbi:MAG TPA: hypothetical protein V6C57_14735 [Coleofasciculaceae cyanobacterium]
MKKLLFKFMPWLSLLILTLALLLGGQQFGSAQLISQSTGQLDAKISRLESENITLRSRVNNLENQVARLSRASGIAPSSEPIAHPPLATGGSGLADDPVFKRLATLVIELRERIIALEARAGGNPGTVPER